MTNAEMKELDEQLWDNVKPIDLIGKYDKKYTWRVQLEAEPVTVHVNADNADDALERALKYCEDATDVTAKLIPISATIIGITEWYSDRTSKNAMANEEEIRQLEKRIEELRTFGTHGEALE